MLPVFLESSVAVTKLRQYESSVTALPNIWEEKVLEVACVCSPDISVWNFLRDIFVPVQSTEPVRS